MSEILSIYGLPQQKWTGDVMPKVGSQFPCPSDAPLVVVKGTS